MSVVQGGNSTPSKLGCFPPEGGETIQAFLDFTAQTDIDVDLSLFQSYGRWSALQTVYIDNSGNGSPITLLMNVTLQSMSVPAGFCAYLPVLASNPPKLHFATAGGIVVPVNFVNFFIPAQIWSGT